MQHPLASCGCCLWQVADFLLSCVFLHLHDSDVNRFGTSLYLHACHWMTVLLCRLGAVQCQGNCYVPQNKLHPVLVEFVSESPHEKRRRVTGTMCPTSSICPLLYKCPTKESPMCPTNCKCPTKNSQMCPQIANVQPEQPRCVLQNRKGLTKKTEMCPRECPTEGQLSYICCTKSKTVSFLKGYTCRPIWLCCRVLSKLS